jgi:clathrin heavy chain
VKDSQIDSELIYAFAKIDALAELEEFVSGPNQAKIQLIGDRCFDEKLYEAARILFDSVSNFPRLASCYVHLEQYQAAVEAARKASSTKTWKEVNFSCVDAQEFRLAQMCGLNIIIHADELEELCDHYERQGYFEELIHLIEAGLPLERSHMGLFTELGRLYSRYMSEKLMEHIRVNHKKINIPRLIRACELDHHWDELRILYMHDDQFESAVEVMIQHPTQAFDHSVFKEIIVKCKNSEIYHKSINFYLMYEPDLLVNLLLAISHLLDHARVVTDISRAGELNLIKPYMERVQEHNISIVNESLNEVYVSESDYKNLRKSVDMYDKFDQIRLAQLLEKHELLEFRRISAYLFKKNDRFEESIGLSKKDKLFKDAMETAAESKNRDLAESLLKFFVENDDSSCFVACMFTCYDLIRPDVVMELAWKHKLADVAMPYMIQVIREYTQKVDVLEHERQDRIEEKKKKEEEGDEGSAEAQAAAALSSTMPGLLGVQMTGIVPDAPLPFMQTGVPFMRGPYPGQF